MNAHFGLEDAGFDLLGSFHFSVTFVCGSKFFPITDFITMFVLSGLMILICEVTQKLAQS